MAGAERDPITLAPRAQGEGRNQAVDALFPVVYGDLRRRAARMLRAEPSGLSLQTTALVNEAYLRIRKQDQADWQSRAHFCAVAAMAMRRILVEHARAKRRQKRGGGLRRVSLDSDVCTIEQTGDGVDLLALDAALTRLAAIRPRSVKVVELRYFGGLSAEEAAAILEISTRTLGREWRYARSWLRKELGAEASRRPASADGPSRSARR